MCWLTPPTATPDPPYPPPLGSLSEVPDGKNDDLEALVVLGILLDVLQL